MRTSMLVLLMTGVAVADQPQLTKFGSDLVNEGNPRGLNVKITPVPSWETPPPGVSWVSFANTGQGGFSPPNTDKVPDHPTASFWEGIYIVPDEEKGQHHGDHQGHVTVWADDTAQVRLVNSRFPFPGKVLAEAQIVLDEHCAKHKPGCESKEGKRINLTPHLTHGWNLLLFDVYQLGLDGFGLMYQGSVDLQPK